MENKKKKGFTLIELLAIIVILAIIAVITVPIILNIIENSKKGAVIDSAYGYKDAVNKAYVTKLSENKELKLNGTYTVGSDGTLTGNFNNPEITSLPVDVSGTVPTGGTLTYSNNILTGGYLIIEDYRATFNSDGTVTVEKNTPGEAIIEPTTKPMAFETKNSLTTIAATEIATGSYVIIGDEGFYAMSEPSSNGTVRLLSEYNISNTGTSQNLAYRQDSSNDFEKIKFSTSKYWDNCVATSSESTPTCSNPYRPSEIDLAIDAAYYENFSENIRLSGYVYDSNSNLYNPINNYKNYLETMIGNNNIIKARPVSEIEMAKQLGTEYVWPINQEYWLGTVQNSALWDDNSDSSTPIPGNAHYVDIANNEIKESGENKTSGIRPVIEVSTSIFEQGGVKHPVKPAVYASKGSTQEITASSITKGSYIKIYEEGFYAIETPSDGIVRAVSEYNISNTGTSENLAYKQDSSNNYEKINFSTNIYWINCIATTSTDYVGNEPSQPTCENPYTPHPNDQKYMSSGNAYIYESRSSLYEPMKNYEAYLATFIGENIISEIRPLSEGEFKTFFENTNDKGTQEFWLGTLYSRGSWGYSDGYVHYSQADGGGRVSDTYDSDVIELVQKGEFNNNKYYLNGIDADYGKFGIRPLIEIPISAFNK